MTTHTNGLVEATLDVDGYEKGEDAWILRTEDDDVTMWRCHGEVWTLWLGEIRKDNGFLEGKDDGTRYNATEVLAWLNSARKTE